MDAMRAADIIKSRVQDDLVSKLKCALKGRFLSLLIFA